METVPQVLQCPAFSLTQSCRHHPPVTCHQVKYFKGTFQDPVNFFQVPLINAVARELSRSYVARARNSSSSSSSAVDLLSSPDAFEWSPRLVRFPHPSLQTVNLLGQVLSSFIFASLMFGSVSQVGDGGCIMHAGQRLRCASHAVQPLLSLA